MYLQAYTNSNTLVAQLCRFFNVELRRRTKVKVKCFPFKLNRSLTGQSLCASVSLTKRQIKMSGSSCVERINSLIVDKIKVQISFVNYRHLCTVIMIEGLISINPLTPRSDKNITSPHNVHTLSSKQVTRIFKLIRLKLLSGSNTKFSTNLAGNV